MSAREVSVMAEREQRIAALKAAFVEGRLTKEEFDLRVYQALAFYAELDVLTADIPAVPPAVIAPTATARADPARETANKKMIHQGTAAITGLTFLLVAVVVMPRSPVAGVIAAVVITTFVALLSSGLLTLLSWAMDRRSGVEGAGGAGPAQGSPPGAGGDTANRQGVVGHEGRRPELGQDPPGTVQAAKRRPRRLATSPA
jgi:hypothetical protein